MRSRFQWAERPLAALQSPLLFLSTAILLSLLTTNASFGKEREIARSDFAGVELLLLEQTKPETIAPPTYALTIRCEGCDTYSHRILRSPHRFVIDIPEKSIPRSYQITPLENVLIKQIRIGLHTKFMRVVLDLEQAFVVSAEFQPAENEVLALLVPELLAAERTGEVDLDDTEAPSAEEVAVSADEVLSESEPSSAEDEPPQPGTIAPPASAAAARPLPQESSPSLQAPKVLRLSAQGLPETIDVPLEELQEKARLSFSVDKVFLGFRQEDRPVENLEVRNLSDKTLYLTAKVQEVINPSAPTPERQETSSLLVSPKRFSINARDTRTVRVVLKPIQSDSERVFNIVFTPEETPFDNQLLRLQTSGQAAQLQVITGLSILVTAQPSNAKRDFSWKRSPSAIVFENKGNISVELTEGKFCKLPNKDCIPIGSRRVYPGDSLRLEAPPFGYISFLSRSSAGYEQVAIAPVEAKNKKPTNQAAGES